MAVSIHYTLTNDSGEQLDSSRGEAPLEYLHGFGQIIKGLEKALLGKQVGDTLNVTIQPEEAYGVRQDNLEQIVSMDLFQGVDRVEEGMQFHADASHGVDIVTVTKIDGDQVTIDGNHPLAGEALTFDVEIIDIRPATEDEINHKHIHGSQCNH